MRSSSRALILEENTFKMVTGHGSMDRARLSSCCPLRTGGLNGEWNAQCNLRSLRLLNYSSGFSPSCLMCNLSAFYYCLELFFRWTDWNWGCKSDFPMASQQASGRVQVFFSFNVFIKLQDSFPHMSHSLALQINLVQTQFYGLSVAQTNSNRSHKPWIFT